MEIFREIMKNPQPTIVYFLVKYWHIITILAPIIYFGITFYIRISDLQTEEPKIKAMMWSNKHKVDSLEWILSKQAK